jgi:ATP-dependent protease HslVU (ClpYQ) peptidase subunit
MTCIVGIETKDGVIIGGDSAGTGGYSQSIRVDEKVWEAGEFIFGFTSSFRMGQLLRYRLNPPRRPDKDATQAERDEWMTTEFIDAVRKLLKDGGYAKVENGVERGGTFLVGWRGTLYCVQRDFQVARTADGYDAVGSGGENAVGALFASDSLESKARVKLALEAATHFNAAVAPPFKIIEKKWGV